MSAFKRTKQKQGAPTDLSTALLQGHDMIEQVGRAHAERWGLGTANSWSLDQETCQLRWSFADKVAEAPAQILGSFNPSTGGWIWAWANESVLPALRRD